MSGRKQHALHRLSATACGAVASFAAALADCLFPACCMLCGKLAPLYYSGFCEQCYRDCSLIAGPVCTKCGTVFKSREGADHLCGVCIAEKVYYDTARSAGVYSGALRGAIQMLKFKKKTMLGRPLAALAADRTGRQLRSAAYDVVLPVPLHPRRLRQRGYNQALLLALHVGALWDVPVEREYLTRRVWRSSQTRLTGKERRREVRGAFACRDRLLAGKRVLLVDDVFTSGATANECARTLKKNGVAAVDVLTVARTVRENAACTR